MNKNCLNCPHKEISKKLKEEFFNFYFNKNFECPIEEENVLCIYSKFFIDWEKVVKTIMSKRSNSIENRRRDAGL